MNTACDTRNLAARGSWMALTPGRRATLVGFAMMGFMVLLTGVALACVPWKGEVTVGPDSSTGSSTTVHGNGTMHGWCANDEPVQPARIPVNGRISISANGKSNCDDKLGDNVYDVTFAQAGFIGWPTVNGFTDTHYTLNCMSTFDGVGHYTAFLGVVEVSNGQITRHNPVDRNNGTNSFFLPPPASDPNNPDELVAGAVCLTERTAGTASEGAPAIQGSGFNPDANAVPVTWITPSATS